ncbi:hypothetical protein Ssi03_57570 [Sphaerisporangium siamense]|nr:hypothetical protein Ssi03_57570 [Sphaerisporangium siamense]
MAPVIAQHYALSQIIPPCVRGASSHGGGTAIGTGVDHAKRMSSALWLRISSAALAAARRPPDGVGGMPESLFSLPGSPREPGFSACSPSLSAKSGTSVPDFGQMDGGNACLSMNAPTLG